MAEPARTFVIAAPSEESAIIRFEVEFLDHERTVEEDRELAGAFRAAKVRRIALDLARCADVTSGWINYLADRTREATATGKRVTWVGVLPLVRKSADLLGHDDIRFADGVDEALAP